MEHAYIHAGNCIGCTAVGSFISAQSQNLWDLGFRT